MAVGAITFLNGGFDNCNAAASNFEYDAAVGAAVGALWNVHSHCSATDFN